MGFRVQGFQGSGLRVYCFQGLGFRAFRVLRFRV